MRQTYSQNYQDPRTAAAYDEVICRSEHDPVWAAERRLLERMIRKHVPDHAKAKAVDFACGTGRILEAVKPLVGTLTGIDISQAMLDRAAKRVSGVELVRADVVADPDAVPADLDLVTSFRFLLLAEPSLREACMRSLVRRLKPDTGVLLVNSHGNPRSFRSLATLRDRLTGRPRTLKAFSDRDMRSLAQTLGMRIVGATGCGFVPMSLQRVLPAGVTRRIEGALAGAPGLWRFGTNIIYVLKRSA